MELLYCHPDHVIYVPIIHTLKWLLTEITTRGLFSSSVVNVFWELLIWNLKIFTLHAHFHVFSYDAYAQVPKDQRGKMDSKSRRLVFVGYQISSTGYGLCDPTTKEVVVSS